MCCMFIYAAWGVVCIADLLCPYSTGLMYDEQSIDVHHFKLHTAVVACHNVSAQCFRIKPRQLPRTFVDVDDVTNIIAELCLLVF